MSDPKKDEKKDPAAGAPAVKGKGRGRIVAALGVLLVVGISSVAGAALSPIIGPHVGGAPAAPKAAKPPPHLGPDGEPMEEDEEEAASEKEKKGEPKGLLALDAVVVDLRDAANETHHLKIGIGIELKKELPEEESKLFVMRAKDAEITYLRTLTYEEVTDHAKFEPIRKELGVRVLKAFGKNNATKLLITEYVVQ